MLVPLNTALDLRVIWGCIWDGNDAICIPYPMSDYQRFDMIFLEWNDNIFFDNTRNVYRYWKWRVFHTYCFVRLADVWSREFHREEARTPIPPRNPHLQSTQTNGFLGFQYHIHFILHHMNAYHVCNCGYIYIYTKILKLGVFRCHMFGLPVHVLHNPCRDE